MAGNTELSIYDAGGFIYGWTSRPDEEVPDVLIDDIAAGCVEGRWDGKTHWWNGTAVVERPTLPVQPTYTVAKGGTLVIEDLPAGTQVWMNEIWQGATEEVEESFVFEESGQLTLTLEPFPYKGLSVLVNVV